MTVFGGPDIVTDGLVLHLDAANRKSYPGSGSTWYDLSGNGHNGTFFGNTALSGKVMTFDGNGDYVTIGNDSDYNSVTNLTVEAMVKFKRNGNFEYIVSNARDCCGSYKGYEVRLYSNRKIYMNVFNGSSVTLVSNSVLELEQYYHICCTYDGAQMKIYINSTLDRTANTSLGIGSPASFNLQVGRMGYSSNYVLQGEIGIVKIYNRALSANEVQQNYNALKGRFGL